MVGNEFSGDAGDSANHSKSGSDIIHNGTLANGGDVEDSLTTKLSDTEITGQQFCYTINGYDVYELRLINKII